MIKKLKKKIRSLTLFDKILWLFIIFGLFTKFLFLGSFPPGMAHDEFDMILSSRAIAHTGADLSGVPFPLFFIKTGMEAKQTNVIPFMLSPYFRFAHLNLFTATLPFVVINLILLLGIIKLTGLFIKDKRLLLAIAIVFLASPWAFDFGRRSFAPPTSLCYLIWGLYFVFRENSKPLLASLLFFISSVCYMGSLIVVPPIGVLAFGLRYYQDRKDFKKYFSAIAILSAAVLFFISASYFIEGGTIKQREHELQFSEIQTLSEVVDEKRRLSMEFPGKDILINKYTVFAVNTARDYFRVFGVDNLIFTGDTRFVYTFNDHGLIYIWGFVFLLIGVSVVRKLSKNFTLLLALVAAVAPLGAALNKVDFTFIYRAFPILAVYIVLIAIGLNEVLKTKMRYIAIALYFVSFSGFLAFYFLMYPVRLGENFDVPERLAVNTAIRERAAGKKVKIIALTPYHVAKQLVFYANENKYIVPYVNGYLYENMIINPECDTEGADVVITDARLDCPKPDKPYIAIQQQKDAGYRYRIYGSSICDGTALELYKRSHMLSDYKIESIGNAEFCNRWIFRPL